MKDNTELPRGLSILERIWLLLDETMDALMADGKNAHPQTRGQALGLAMAIAVLAHPDLPTVDAVRREAVERWERRQPKGRAKR